MKARASIRSYSLVKVRINDQWIDPNTPEVNKEGLIVFAAQSTKAGLAVSK